METTWLVLNPFMLYSRYKRAQRYFKGNARCLDGENKKKFQVNPYISKNTNYESKANILINTYANSDIDIYVYIYVQHQ